MRKVRLKQGFLLHWIVDDPELEVDEEAFSIDDFESNLSSTEETESPTVVSEAVTSSDGGGEPTVTEVSKA